MCPYRRLYSRRKRSKNTRATNNEAVAIVGVQSASIYTELRYYASDFLTIIFLFTSLQTPIARNSPSSSIMKTLFSGSR